MRLLSRLTVLAGLVLVLCTPAQAQDTPSFDLRHFQPSVGPFGVFTAEQSKVLDHLAFSVRLIGDYASDPLVELRDDGTENVLVSAIGSAQLTAALGLFDIAEVGVVVPFVFLNEGNFGGQVLADNGIGDIHLVAKARALHPDDYAGFGLGGGIDFGFPSGDDASFLGDGFLTFRAFVGADYNLASAVPRVPLLFVANLGFTWREESTVKNAVSGATVDWKAGVQYTLLDRQLFALLEFFGAFPASSAFGDDFTAPAEWLVGLRLETDTNLHFFAGGGTGLGGGVGNPLYRLLIGVEYAVRDNDPDRDGIVGSDDTCPGQPEDMDGFQDEDGCPEDDNDEDGIADAKDSCPDQAEDMDGVQDEDGCPDPDTDGDGIDDVVDACVDEAEDVDDFEDEDGCPEPDNDEDGVLDASDQCPVEPEDRDGFQDEDGCADHDNDSDGIVDKQDLCPDNAEDMDNFNDTDGCPDFDNDIDGFCDPWVATSGMTVTICTGTDACPDEAEVINGVDDTDGCPDEGKSLVIVSLKRIEILEKVFFATSKSKIKSKSYPVLDQVAIAMQNNVQITKLRVEGHTDNTGNAEKNKSLSQERADAVVAYLVKKGVDPARLQAVGYGQEIPIDTNDTDEGRANNRRVEFNVAEIDGKPMKKTPEPEPQPE